MNITKMKHQLVRDVSDAVWKDFDRDLSLTVGIENAKEYIEWREWFCTLMKLKYEDKFISVNIFCSDVMDTGIVRVQLNAVLGDPMVHLRAAYDDGVMSANNAIRRALGQGPRYE